MCDPQLQNKERKKGREGKEGGREGGREEGRERRREGGRKKTPWEGGPHHVPQIQRMIRWLAYNVLYMTSSLN
jgi:hypothetical protein